MQRLLEGKVAVVTGAARGIGYAIAKSFRDEGASVAIGDFDDQAGHLAATALTGSFMKLDVSSEESVKNFADWVLKLYGRVDVLVNNAGVTRDGMLAKMSKEMWDHVIAVDLTGPFLMMRAFLPGMGQQGWGRVINISSVNGVKGQFGQANYAAAKAGLIALSKTAALEYAKKRVTVNAIAPGYVDTEILRSIPKEVMDNKILPQVPMGRLGATDEIASLAVYLASERAGFMTGATLNVNGGMHMQ